MFFCGADLQGRRGLNATPWLSSQCWMTQMVDAQIGELDPGFGNIDIQMSVGGG